tara:strand:+ start:205 stop:765 length:561 start_codon:yes stop_codon:yes gene_type:complete
MTKANTATIGHNEAPEEVTLEQIATAAFNKEKIALKAVESKEKNFDLLLTRLTDDGALPGFNTKLEDDTYNPLAVICRMAMVTNKGSRAAHVWTTETGLSTADKALKSSLIKNVGSRMSKLSKALEKHQSDEKGRKKLTFTQRLVKGIKLAHYQLSQYEEDKHGAVTFNRRDVSSSLEKALKQLEV